VNIVRLDRRSLLIQAGGAALAPILGFGLHSVGAVWRRLDRRALSSCAPLRSRVARGAAWETLNRQVRGQPIKPESPLHACRDASRTESCAEVFKRLKNPYYLGDEVALTQTLGWVDAWTSQPSAYAVAARTTADVVAAVNFAREHRLRLVVKGGGHSYLGISNAPDSLLIWTRQMNAVTVHDAFVAAGYGGRDAAQPAVTVEAGPIWAHVYHEVTTQAGRYVQGGGCVTVGVAGLIQSGGFDSFSKRYGLAAAALLEAEVVTAERRRADRQRVHESRSCSGASRGTAAAVSVW
jgi:FAD binding domain